LTYLFATKGEMFRTLEPLSANRRTEIKAGG